MQLLVAVPKLEEQGLGLALALALALGLLTWDQQAEVLVLGHHLLAWDLEQALALEQEQGRGQRLFPLGHNSKWPLDINPRSNRNPCPVSWRCKSKGIKGKEVSHISSLWCNSHRSHGLRCHWLLL